MVFLENREIFWSEILGRTRILRKTPQICKIWKQIGKIYNSTTHKSIYVSFWNFIQIWFSDFVSQVSISQKKFRNDCEKITGKKI